MEHSNSSNSNSPNDSHNNNSTPNQGQTAGDQPSRSFKMKGKFTPKQASPDMEQLQGGGLHGAQPTYGQSGSPYEGQTYGQQSYHNGQPMHTQAPGAPGGLGGALAPRKHSGLGISSFILSLIAILLTVIAIITIVVSVLDMSETDILLLSDPAYIESMLLSSDLPPFLTSVIIGVVLMMGTAFIAFIGFVLGCISLFMKGRKKVFGILGTIFNGLLCFGGFIFFVISFLSSFAA